jgi:deazaflavin-dependent oxidoreductase (nitroreductase family)
MAGFAAAPKFLLRLIHFPPRVLYALGLGPLIGRIILLLTTTGRKTGKPRVTPLQYEMIDGKVYLGASLGVKTDWYRNILADPKVTLRIGARRVTGRAATVTDAGAIADFLEVRLRRHPRMVGMMLRMEGMRTPPSREELEAYARQLTQVVVTPDVS